MTPEQLAVIADLVRGRSGVVIDTSKTYVIETRLAPVARREGFASIAEMIQELSRRREPALTWAVVEALSSTETQFFRDKLPFQQMREHILPALAPACPGGLKVWSVGCSTGQEPYSLAMLAEEESGRFPGLQIDILAADLSERCLEKAHAGLYTQFEVQRGLPARSLVKYFDKIDEAWVLSPRIRHRVRFARMNLLTDVRGAGPFDVIFCRNILSAFDEPTRQSVLEALAGALADHGYLVLGLSEVFHLVKALRPVPGRPGLYTRDPACRAVA
jgi:chemotaxis protein methyltransferase CheR